MYFYFLDFQSFIDFKQTNKMSQTITPPASPSAPAHLAKHNACYQVTTFAFVVNKVKKIRDDVASADAGKLIPPQWNTEMMKCLWYCPGTYVSERFSILPVGGDDQLVGVVQFRGREISISDALASMLSQNCSLFELSRYEYDALASQVMQAKEATKFGHFVNQKNYC